MKKSEYNWHGAIRALIASGLTVRKFYVQRAAEFLIAGTVPSLAYFQRSVAGIRRERFALASNVDVVNLEENDPATQATLAAGSGSVSNYSVRVSRPDGLTIEIASPNPERFLLQLVSLQGAA